MPMMKEEMEYDKKYGHIPSDKEEILRLLESQLRPKDYEDMQKKIETIESIPWHEMKFILYLVPKSTPRPRYSSKTGTFYVKNAAHNKKMLEKIRNLAMDDARAITGASGKDRKIHITDKQWQAIQAGAISDTRLREILKFTDDKEIKELALPKKKTTLSSATQNKLKQLHNSGFTIAEIADILGYSTSTVSKYLNN